VSDLCEVLTLASLVVTGTKPKYFEGKAGIPLEQVPQSVQLVDQREMVERGGRSIEDAIHAVLSATAARSEVGGFSSAPQRIREFCHADLGQFRQEDGDED
jgi:iron complex outermembrane receptor protein